MRYVVNWASPSLRRGVLGLLVGGAGLWLAFRGTDASDLVAALARVQLGLAALALASTVLTLCVVTWRWRLLFHPHHREQRFAPLFRAVVIGQMVNIVSPLRVGEVARVYAIADGKRLSKTHVVATLAIEKVLDLLVFGMVIALLVSIMALPEGVRVKGSAQIGVGLGALLALWGVARWGLPFARWVERHLPPLPLSVRRTAHAIVHRFVEGLTTLRRPRIGAALVAQSLAVVCCSALTNYLLFLAFGLQLPPWAALFLLVLLQVGAVSPSLPGKLGVFNYLVVVGLGVFGVSRPDALSYSIVLYAVALLPKILLGAVYIVGTPLPWRPHLPR